MFYIINLLVMCDTCIKGNVLLFNYTVYIEKNKKCSTLIMIVFVSLSIMFRQFSFWNCSQFFCEEINKVSYKELKVLVIRPQVKDAGKDSTLVETYWNFIFVLKRQTSQDLWVCRTLRKLVLLNGLRIQAWRDIEVEKERKREKGRGREKT